MFERFTHEAREVVIGAQREARGLHHRWIGTEHVLLSLVGTPEAPGVTTLTRLGVTAAQARDAVLAVAGDGADGLGDEDTEALKAFGIDLDEVRKRAEETFGEGALDAPLESGRGKRFGLFGRRKAERGPGHIPFAPRAKKALELSLREALALKDGFIGTQHIVLGLLRSDDQQTLAVFERLGIDPRETRREVLADLRKAA
ncbi:Clp protease N-terminal domain-containing protein [Jiangella mangrovi]|uniref:ATP-dependent Clp protease ATP-binding subunit ClpA n=1 Tax=Jiangella mangrovi TaxID=1524084 RepID=A0A7W9LNS8_9ACTN|nr:Clp protease N-terminal domain-containing protein [Jiangella mangrovi]MBB5790437.1 ATP-dependent Clp protease ATP-binding subunit ClpA [Jiangella mangrovi]